VTEPLVGLPSLVAAGGLVIGVMFALLKWFAQRLLADIDTRLRRIDEVERRLERVTAELPQHYQRREDAVRELALVDERYQKLVESLVGALRREVVSAAERLEAMERAREADRMIYQLRDDAIREYTAINAKLDRLYELMMKANK
jgi:DNA repair ATPase RecN